MYNDKGIICNASKLKKLNISNQFHVNYQFVLIYRKLLQMINFGTRCIENLKNFKLLKIKLFPSTWISAYLRNSWRLSKTTDNLRSHTLKAVVISKWLKKMRKFHKKNSQNIKKFHKHKFALILEMVSDRLEQKDIWHHK